MAAIWLEWLTWRPISAIEDDNSSVADATVCTLAALSSDAAATAPACLVVSSAVALIDWADDFHLGGLAGDGLHHALDLGVEVAGQLVDQGAARGGDALGFFLLGLQAVAFDHAGLEHLHGGGHLADFVLAADADRSRWSDHAAPGGVMASVMARIGVETPDTIIQPAATHSSGGKAQHGQDQGARAGIGLGAVPTLLLAGRDLIVLVGLTARPGTC